MSAPLWYTPEIQATYLALRDGDMGAALPLADMLADCDHPQAAHAAHLALLMKSTKSFFVLFASATQLASMIETELLKGDQP